MSRIRIRLAAVLVTGMLAACDPSGRGYEDRRLARLKEGQSTEQDVIKVFGKPAAVRDVGGGRGLVYPLGPEAPYTLLLKIDPKGRYQGRENLLTRPNFERINMGTRQTEVLALLGPPTRTQAIAPKNQVAWEWRFQEGGSRRVFVVTFDQAGRIVATAIEDNARKSGS
jgi:outer membrane protein assembly factor BamE (lipoprotein component of BamABCDE complex)